MIHSESNFTLSGISVNAHNKMSCPDNYVGYIVYNSKEFEGFNGDKVKFGLLRNAEPKVNPSVQQRKDIDYSSPHKKTNRRIIVLLESPHIDEYIPNNANFSGPAMGKTGNRFNNQAIKLFNKFISVMKKALLLSKKEEFDVYFINAIQYQCSLGNKNFNRDIRDFVFTELWNSKPNSFKDDLIERLNILKPDLIINACTKNLQQTCCNKRAIVNELSGFKYSFISANKHVSCWDKNTNLM